MQIETTGTATSICFGPEDFQTALGFPSTCRASDVSVVIGDVLRRPSRYIVSVADFLAAANSGMILIVQMQQIPLPRIVISSGEQIAFPTKWIIMPEGKEVYLIPEENCLILCNKGDVKEAKKAAGLTSAFTARQCGENVYICQRVPEKED